MVAGTEVVRRTYENRNGNLASETYANGCTYLYEYDKWDRITEIRLQDQEGEELMIISQAKSLALNMTSVTASTATLFVSVVCLFNTAGRLGAGIISDKLGRINTITAALIMALIGLSCLYLCGITSSVGLLFVGVMLTGVCFGTFMGVFPGFCTDQFGAKYNTVNYGIMWIGFSVAGIIGPSILTNVFRVTNSYQGAFVIAFIIALVGLGLSFVYRRIVRCAQNKVSF